jgi:cysteine synthase A
LLADFKDERLDFFVSGYGTGGTVTGVGRVLRKERPNTRIVLSEPQLAPLLGSGIAQQRGEQNSPAASHPAFTPHPIQGWTPDFIPHVLQEAVDNRYYDELIPVAGADAMAWSKRLAAEEGIFTGISGGASLAAAIQVAQKAPEGSVLCCMLPDTGERYLSTPLFADVSADMNDEELEISRSTPGSQLSS